MDQETENNELKQANAEDLSTEVTEQDLAEGREDEYGVIYSMDGKRLLRGIDIVDVEQYNIKDGTEVICDKAFKENSILKSVIISDSVLCIGDSAFYRCDSLQSVAIPDSVTNIGPWAFA